MLLLLLKHVGVGRSSAARSSSGSSRSRIKYSLNLLRLLLLLLLHCLIGIHHRLLWILSTWRTVRHHTWLSRSLLLLLIVILLLLLWILLTHLSIRIRLVGIVTMWHHDSSLRTWLHHHTWWMLLLHATRMLLLHVLIHRMLYKLGLGLLRLLLLLRSTGCHWCWCCGYTRRRAARCSSFTRFITFT